jgi:hypothetical protein
LLTLASACSSAVLPRALEAKAATCHIVVKRHTEGDPVPEFTLFVTTGDLVMSLHALLAIADGRPIVTLNWLKQSVAAGVTLDTSSYLVADKRAEKAHTFSYKSSWYAARKRRLLEGARAKHLRRAAALSN